MGLATGLGPSPKPGQRLSHSRHERQQPFTHGLRFTCLPVEMVAGTPLRLLEPLRTLCWVELAFHVRLKETFGDLGRGLG